MTIKELIATLKEMPDGGSLWEVQTDKGVFWEYSENLEVEG